MSCCRCVRSTFATRPLMCSVSLLPRALAVVTSAHQPRAFCERVGIQAWAWQCMRRHAWACVGPRQGYRGRVTRRACTAERDTAAPTIGRYTRPASDRHAAHNRCIVQLWRTRVDHAHGYVARAHLICVLGQLDYRVSSEPPSGRSTRLPARIERHQLRGPSGHLLMMSWLDIVDQRLIWPGTTFGKTHLEA